MSWMLIILLYAGTGVSSNSVEFTSLDKCTQAAHLLQQDKMVGIDTFCVRK